MYEDMTYDRLLQEGLAQIPDDVLKGEGSLTFNAVSVMALELEKLYRQSDYLRDQLDPETAEYDSLLRLAAGRGIFPTEASSAQFKVTADKELPNGTRFRLSGFLFTIIGKGDNYYIAECTPAGAAPNNLRGKLTPIDFVQGLTEAKITDVLVAGRDASTRDEILNEYLESYKVQAFGGNQKDYVEHLMKFDGVGGCRIFPTWNGATTVKCVLIGSDYGKMSEEQISKIQGEMCPTPLKGYGIAPIGHDVTVKSVTEKKLTIKLKLTYAESKSFGDVQEAVKKAIDGYLLTIRKAWGETHLAGKENDTATVYVARISAAILDVGDVKDVQKVTINDGTENIVVGAEEIPVLESVTEEAG